MDKKEKLGIAGLYYVVTVIVGYLALTVGSLLLSGTDAEKLIYLFEPTALTVSAIIFSVKSGKTFDTLKIKKAKAWYIPLVIGIFAVLFFSVGFFNNYLANLLKSLGLRTGGSVTDMDGVGEYVLSVLTLALAPAIGEELFFRGALLSNFEDDDETFVCLIIGLLFALYHKNLAQLIYQFVYGFILTYITLHAKSVFPAILLHFLNNFTVLTCSYFLPNVNIFNIVAVIIASVLFVAGVIFYILKLIKHQKTDYKPFFIGGICGIIFCLIITVLNNFGEMMGL